ncbi:MAG TPA: hypothetical protein VH414_20810 [Lichenihabitans sp.]|jgi:surface antigen|nr:hypothetical protein [Lichenihabitans sp.]
MCKAWIAVMGAALLGAGVGGCSMTGTDDGGQVPLASLGTPAVPAVPGEGTPAAPPAAPVSMGPFLDGPIGAKLAMADRDNAFKAETSALSTGDRKSWRGQKGTYGFVVPGAVEAPAPAASDAAPDATTGAAPGECRSFTHTIFFAGRPQVGHGTGCRDPDGSWRITG